MTTLKEKAIHSAKWAMIDNYLNLFVSVVISILLSRLLVPSDFGLIGMITFLIALMNVFVTSGFSFSLVRTEEATQEDYSTIFFFNIGVCLVCYLLLFIIAPWVALFFDQPQLTELLRVLGLTVVIGAFSVVLRAIRVKELNYKIQAKISIVGTLASGGIALILAYYGFGVWSLVAQTLLKTLFDTLLLWFTSWWRPVFLFSKKHLLRHWKYSFSLLRNDLTIVLFDNLYVLTIGKFYNSTLLGQYTRAKSFLDVPVMGVSCSISNGISYPILCKNQANPDELRRLFLRFLSLITFISSTMVFYFASVSDSIIPFLIGSKWLLAADYIKIIAFSSVIYPISVYCISIARVVGKTKQYANATLFQRILIIPVVIVGYWCGIKIMLYGMVLVSVISLIYNMTVANKLVGVDLGKLCRTILSSLILPLCAFGLTFLLGTLLVHFSLLARLLIQLLFGALCFYLFGTLFGQKDFLELKRIALNELKKINI